MSAIAPLQDNQKTFVDDKSFPTKNDARGKFAFFLKNKTHIKNIAKTILGRLGLIVYSFWITAFVSCATNENLYWLLAMPIFLIILDTMFICLMRKGIEFDLFSLSIYFYTIIMMVCIWTASEFNYEHGDPECKDLNSTIKIGQSVKTCPTVSGIFFLIFSGLQSFSSQKVPMAFFCRKVKFYLKYNLIES